MSFPFSRIRNLLIDLDGVLYRGMTVLPGARDFIGWLREMDIGFRLVTNNATLTPQQYVEKLASMGIEIKAHEVFTSALATALYLEDAGQSKKSVSVVGQDGLVDAVKSVGMTVTSGQPDWVVVGLDRQLTYDKLAAASLAIERGARFIGTNPDTSFPTERGLEPGAGAILAAIEATTGVHPIVIGKPQPLMLELAMQQLRGTIEDTAMLGDRLDTDIAAAEAAHLPSILVLTGVSKRAEVTRFPYTPSLIVETLPDLVDQWRSDALSPR